MASTIYANYQVTDTFELDFDINDAYDWEIKFGTLRVTMNEGDEEIEIEPTCNNSSQFDFKHCFIEYIQE